jgi:hypothetical protein
MVCGDPDAGAPYWGYTPGDPYVLKSSRNNTDVGPGNFQLVQLGDDPGGDVLRDAMAGNYDGCASAGDVIATEPGAKVASVSQGMNTRFGTYFGAMKGTEALYPPDVITQQTSPVLRFDHGDPRADPPIPPKIYVDGTEPQVVVSKADDLSYNYGDYSAALRAKSFDKAPPTGHYLRREVAIPVGDCSETTEGRGSVPLLGFACYFLLQEAEHTGEWNYVFGQFIRDCGAGGMPGPDPGDGPGLYIIQLYKDPDSPEA